MKRMFSGRNAAAALAAVMLLAILTIGVSAVGEKIYVNNGDGTLDTAIGDAYAIGGSGAIDKIAGAPAYALTGSGIATIGEAEPTPTPEPAPVINVPTLNIGINYAGNENAAVTIQNIVGSGFKFGFYDANRNFHEVGETTNTKLTVMKDKNVTVSAGTVGCFHIKLPATYKSFSDAQSAATAYTDGFPAYYNGNYYVLAGHYTTRDAAAAAMASRNISGETYTASSKCVVVTATGSTKILFEFDYGDTFSLAVRPVSSAGSAVTSFAEKTHNGAAIKYYGDFQFRRINGDNLTTSNFINIEDYIKGVVPYEMSASWPLEALKAQAVCARTYAAANLNKHKSYGFDTCSEVCCQAYRGTNSATSLTDQAVDTTKGQYVTYNGTLCTTMYFSSDGGATEDNENVNSAVVPYLKGVEDPYEAAIDFEYSYKSWSYEWSADTIRNKLTAKGYTIGNIVSIEPEYTRMGNMYKLTFTDSTGKSLTISKYYCVTVMGLPSLRYTVTAVENKPNIYKIDGKGWGHSVGMSQWGAYAMARYYGKTYAEIIKFYYTGVTVG